MFSVGGAILVLASLFFLFLPQLSLQTAYGETIDVPSLTLIFGGQIEKEFASGTYYLSFKPNVFYFIILQISLLGILSGLMSKKSLFNSAVTILLLVGLVVFYALIPQWISTVNQGYSPQEFTKSIGYYFPVILSSLALVLHISGIVLRRKESN